MPTMQDEGPNPSVSLPLACGTCLN
uniref:Uncharacterized protein n=1 Tax=Anguilla anguilla TaxID=7936 RepID=A0A0E9Q0K3_ANGAN